MNISGTQLEQADRTISIAPMMEWTDRYFRYFLRLITRHAWLYTEMVTTGEIIHGDRERCLSFDPKEHPIALQLGGSDPKDLALCARIGESYGYDEINLNVGCPSARVSSGRFGACLMAEPDTVADCVAAMKEAVSVPVTVKTRIGIDEHDSFEKLAHFVERVSKAGSEIFIIHARKAWLSGLSPKQNREIPPLNYQRVYEIKREFRHLTIIINGGLTSLDEARKQLERVDGVMFGREAYTNPYFLANVDQQFYGALHSVASREEILENLVPFVERQLSLGMPLHHMTRHILGLFHARPGARAYRRVLTEESRILGAGIEILRKAMANACLDLSYPV